MQSASFLIEFQLEPQPRCFIVSFQNSLSTLCLLQSRISHSHLTSSAVHLSALATTAPATVDPSVRANVIASRRQIACFTGRQHPARGLNGHGISHKGGDNKLERDWRSHVRYGDKRAGEAWLLLLGEGGGCIFAEAGELYPECSRSQSHTLHFLYGSWESLAAVPVEFGMIVIGQW